VHFDARVRPRWVLGVALVALGGLQVWSSVAVRSLTGTLEGLFTSVVFGMLAVREWNHVRLRITETSILHTPPDWAPGRLRIDACEVAELAWDGHDNIGLRMRDGCVDVVAFRWRIPAARQEAAREAILRFVERVTGKPRPAPPLDVAPWLVRRPVPGLPPS
jgi:hypothetical protein